MPLYSPQMERLGSTVLASDATTSSVVTIPPRDMLWVIIHITGYPSGGDLAALRFNGATTAYNCRYLQSAAGVATWTNVQTLNTSMARLFANTSQNGRSVSVTITNRAASTKKGSVTPFSGTNSTATAPVIEAGGFEWVNTSAQISSIQLVVTGTNGMTAGSGFIVFGANF